MLKIISSKNDDLVYREISQIKKKLGFLASSLEMSLLEAIGRVNDVSIFGEREVFVVNFSGEDLEMLGFDIKNGNVDLSIFNESENLYFFLGSGVEFEKFFSAGKAGIESFEVIKLEEKKTFDFPTDLVNALQKGDKKGAWNLLLRELKGKDAEPVHGTCIFAYKSLLVYLNDIKRNSTASGVKDFSWNNAKRNAVTGKRYLQEVKKKYFELIEIYHRARMGEGDLKSQLELWILS